MIPTSAENLRSTHSD